MQAEKISPLPLSPDPSRRVLLDQISWCIADCKEHHTICTTFEWSNRNPSNLIQIIPNSGTVKLVTSPPNKKLDYIALSYTWGDKKLMGDDWEKVRANRTKETNVEERHCGFPRDQLSKTLRDAIQLTEDLGIRYIWIDAVCIPFGSDWNEEGNRVPEIYGNAAFTLRAYLSENALGGTFPDSRA